MKRLILLLTLLMIISNAASINADVFINEFMARPSSGYEWIELYNNDTSPKNISNWKINDSISTIKTIPDNTSIEGKGYLVYFFNNKLNNNGDEIKLIDNLGNIIDNYTYSTAEEDISEGRLHDGLEEWVRFTTPTPNSTNNRLPIGTIPNQTIEEDTQVSINPSATIVDLDNDPLTFTIVKENVSKVDCNVINKTNITLTPAPNWNGITDCKVRINDTYSFIDVLFTINVTPVNDRPIIYSIPEIILDEDNYNDTINLSDYVYDIEDSKEDIVWYYLPVENISISISPDKILNITADKDWNGKRNITLGATDTGGLSSSINVTVTVNPTNDAPLFVQNIPTPIEWQEDTANTKINLTPVFYDPDNDVLTYEATPVEDINVTINQNTGIVTLLPNTNFNGIRNITFRAFDGTLYSNYSNVVILNVTPVNDAPQITNFNPPAIGTVGEEYNYQIQANDVDGDNLTFNDNTTLFDINRTTGDIRFTPNISDIGTYTINITVSDGLLNTSKAFTLSIYNALSLSNIKTKINDGYYKPLNAGEVLDNISQGDRVKISLDVKNWLSTHDLTFVKINATIKNNSQTVSTNKTDIDILPKRQSQNIVIDLGTIPAVQNGIYDLIITGIGEYDLKRVYANWSAKVRIQSKAHQILITSTSVKPSKVKCIRDIVVNTSVKNIDGFTEAQETKVVVRNSELGINEETNYSTIQYNDEKTFTIPINIPREATAGTYQLTIQAKTKYNTTDETTGYIEIEDCKVSYFPEQYPIISAKKNTIFGFILPSELSLATAEWQENGENKPEYNNQSRYIFEGKFKNEDYHIKVEFTDNRGYQYSHSWYPKARMYPIAEPYSTIPDLSSLNETQLKNVNLTLMMEGEGEIRFLEPVDLSDIITLGDHVIIQDGIAAINDSDEYYVLNKKAQITLKGLTYQEEPKIYYTEEFTSDRTKITDECPSSVCKIVNISPPSNADGNGIIIFNVTGFSSFLVGSEVPPPPPPGNQAPIPIIEVSPSSRVRPNTIITLDGLSSYDPDGNITSYRWSQEEGPTVDLSNPTSPTISFNTSTTGKYVFKLTVEDNNNQESSTTTTIYVEEASKLRISDLDVKIGDKTAKNIQDGETISREAKPKETIKFNIEIENEYSSSEDITIEDVEVTVTIEDIDDGDELEETADIDKIYADDTESVSIEFTVPTLVDEDTYNVVIDVEGKDENGKIHEETWELKLNVEKEKHSIIIDKADISPRVINCNRNTKLDIRVANIGSKDEDDVSIEIESKELGIGISEKEIELEEGSDEDSIFESIYNLKIDKDVKTGTYPIGIKVYYNDKLADEKTIYLEVQECLTEKIHVEAEPVEIIKLTEPIKKPRPIQPTKISFRDTQEYLTLIAILFIILSGLVIFAIGTIVIIVKKK